MFWIAAKPYFNLRNISQIQSPASCRHFLRSNVDELLAKIRPKHFQQTGIRKLYETACILGSFVVVDPFLSDENYNPYLRKCCILGNVYTGIGLFQNLFDPNETEYQATLTKCLNVNANTGLCHHICTNEAAPGQRQDF